MFNQVAANTSLQLTVPKYLCIVSRKPSHLFAGDLSNGRVTSSKYGVGYLGQSKAPGHSLQRSSSVAGSRNSVDRYTTNSLGRGTAGYASDYGGSNLSLSSSYGAGYNSRYVCLRSHDLWL